VVTKCAGHTAEIPCNAGERKIFDDDDVTGVDGLINRRADLF
jgi:hypothetical protein